jgi:hypothetical protein
MVSPVVALMRPSAETLRVAVPVVLGVNVTDATPAVALTEEAGLNTPDTPLTENRTVLVAVEIFFPLASSMTAVYLIGNVVCELTTAGANASWPPVITLALAYADKGALLVTVPVAQLAGRLLRLSEALFTDRPPEVASLILSLPEPVGLRIAIQ